MSMNVEPAVVCAVLEDVIAAEQARGRAVTSLPVLYADPNLTAYAVEFAKSRANLAIALQDYVALLKMQEEMISGPVLGAGSLLNLMNHSDDQEDGILWRAMLDQAKQTTSDLQSLKEPAAEVERKFVAIRHAASRLSTDELALRAKLSQRFGREFPPLATYAKAAEAARPKPSQLTEQQIVQTLIGKKTGGEFGPWTFEDAKEFVSMEILGTTNRSEVLADYHVRSHVKGIRSGNERDFELRLTYCWFYTRWALVEAAQIR